MSTEELFRRIHVIPVGDVEMHAAQDICWCNPSKIDAELYIHNAKDCREARERLTGKKCSEGWINIAEYAVRSIKIEALTGTWTSRCTVCGVTYENGCGSTPCCGALQEIIEHKQSYE